jgi:hypothetical protein
VAVSGATVTLSGALKAWLERRSAVKPAWTIACVTEVRDEVSIV